MASNPTPHFSACESPPTPPRGPVCVTGSEGPWVFLCAGIGGNAGSRFLFQKDIISSFLKTCSTCRSALVMGCPDQLWTYFNPTYFCCLFPWVLFIVVMPGQFLVELWRKERD